MSFLQRIFGKKNSIKSRSKHSCVAEYCPKCHQDHCSCVSCKKVTLHEIEHQKSPSVKAGTSANRGTKRIFKPELRTASTLENSLIQKYKTKEDASFIMLGDQSYDVRFSICMRLTKHPIPEVRGQVAWDITSPDHELDREQKVVSVLSDLIIHDESLDVRSQAVCALIMQLNYSPKTTLCGDSYPEALKALSAWLRTAPSGQDLFLSNLDLLSDRFFWTVTNTDGSKEFIDSLSAIACDDKRKPSDRNGATIILTRLKDKRCQDVLKTLSADSDYYVSSNAKNGLDQIETN